MSLSFTMGSGGVPAGTYPARFAGIEPYTENAEKFGPGVSIRFVITEGESKGMEATRIVSQKLSPKSALAKFATAIKGSPIATGESFSFDPYVGAIGMIVVEPTESGSTRVAAFFRSPSAQPGPMAMASATEVF